MKWWSAWPVFHGPVILPYILNTIWCMYIIFRIMNLYGPRFDLKINVGHCDLYFMFQWLCLISWRLLDVWTSLFGIMTRYNPTFDLKINVGHCDLYSMVQWFCIISEWPEVWPPNKCRSLWPIIYGPVILPCILKTIWCMNIIIWDYDSVWPDVWP